MLCAAEIYVSPRGSDKRDGSSWQNAKRTLQGALKAASSQDAIFLRSGTYTLSETAEISADLEIVGGFEGSESSSKPLCKKPTIIRGNGNKRLFIVKGASLRASNITFKNGAAKTPCSETSDISGGAFFLDSSNAEFENCIFKNNTASNSKNPENTAGGGAISATNSSTLSASGCQFISNSAASKNSRRAAGGAIFADDTSCDVKISNSLFKKNRAYINHNGDSPASGGVARISGGEISNCIFEKNSASQKKSNGTIYLSLQSSQTGGASGGAIFAEPRLADCAIFQNKFLQNSADGSTALGGAIFTYTPEDAAAEIFSNFFYKNSANSGGAIAAKGAETSSASISSCRFLSNRAASSGGAAAFFPPSVPFEIPPIHIMQIDSPDEFAAEISPAQTAATAPFEIVNSEFEGNAAQLGGAISISSRQFSKKGLEPFAKIFFCTFVGNSAETASAISNNGIADISSCIFADGKTGFEVCSEQIFFVVYENSDPLRYDPIAPRIVKSSASFNIRNCIVPAASSLPSAKQYINLTTQNILEADPQFLGLRTEGETSAHMPSQNSPANNFEFDETADVASDIFGNLRATQKPTIGAAQSYACALEVDGADTAINLAYGEKISIRANAKKYTGALSYKWLVDKNDGKGFVEAKSAKQEIAFTAQKKYPEISYKCLVSDESGASACTGIFKICSKPKKKSANNN